MKILSGDASPGGPDPTKLEIAELARELQPMLLRALRQLVPEEGQRRLGAVTTRQLEALSRLPSEGMTMHEFAKSIGTSGTAATALANRMIRQGLAQRLYDPGDRRTVSLAPTSMGLATARALTESRRRSVTQLLERLRPEQVASFLEVLGALTGAGSGGHEVRPERGPDPARASPRSLPREPP